MLGIALGDLGSGKTAIATAFAGDALLGYCLVRVFIADASMPIFVFGDILLETGGSSSSYSDDDIDFIWLMVVFAVVMALGAFVLIFNRD